VDYGMSGLGPVYFGPQYETTEWGRAVMEPTKISDEIQSRVDKEMQKLLSEAQELARAILKKNKKILDRVSEELVKIETIDGEDFEKLVGVPKARVAAKKVRKSVAVKNTR